MRLVQDPGCAEGVDPEDWSQEFQMRLCELPLGSARAGPAGPAGLARPGKHGQGPGLKLGRQIVVDRSPAR